MIQSIVDWVRNRTPEPEDYRLEDDQYAQYMRKVRRSALTTTRETRYEINKIQKRRPNQLEEAMLKDEILAGRVGKKDL